MKRLDLPDLKIDMFKEYIAQFIFRVALFLVVLWAYFKTPGIFNYIMTKSMQLKLELQGITIDEVMDTLRSQYSIWWIYVIWAIFELSMIVQALPRTVRLTMGAKKVFAKNYYPVEDADQLEMYKYAQNSNFGALKVLISWLLLNGVIGALYVFGIIGTKEVVLVSCAYYVCDLICVIFWCPFQSFMMKNRCCVNCRIFNWGYFMIFTPMVFIRTFLTWSLFFTSVVLLLRWEITFVLHPERFWDGTNAILRCENCQDKICKFKGPKLFECEKDVKIVKKIAEKIEELDDPTIDSIPETADNKTDN